MLKSLSIRNFVLIDKLDIDFNAGFSVLSGETGAGKSILLGALGLLLGQRGDVAMIRSGCEKLSVCGIFEIKSMPNALQKLFSDNDFDISQEIIIKRTLNSDGKGKILINDEPITQKTLREISASLVEVHGQFDNQGLLNPATHLSFLDSYGSYDKELADMKLSYQEFKDLKNQLENLHSQNRLLQGRTEDLRLWINELEKLNPKENEVEQLEVKRKQLMNAEKILENLNTAYQSLTGAGKSVSSALRSAQAALARLNVLTDNAYGNIYNVLDTALINVQEAETEIESASQQVSLNPEELDSLEGRLFALKNLARKHQVVPDELPAVWKKLQEELVNSVSFADNVCELEKKVAEAWEKYQSMAGIVSNLRRECAEVLSRNVMRELPDLKLEKATFSVCIKEKSADFWNQDGKDEVKFEVSTNPGMPAGPLDKIASGGELARFMLALKVNLARNNQTETIIFDEVDSGVGGATAQAVGEKLSLLGENAQVLVVTHSPQVAAQSQNHYKVEKKLENNSAHACVRLLNETEKQEEIARMLSGESITNEARAAAKVLIGA